MSYSFARVAKACLAGLKSYSLILQIIAAIVVAFTFADDITTSTISTFYTISTNIKILLIFFLPIIIFSCLFNSIVAMSAGTLLLFALLIIVCVSNFISSMISYSASHFLAVTAIDVSLGAAADDGIRVLFEFDIAPLVKNDTALIMGIAIGILANITKYKPLQDIAGKLFELSFFVLKRLFIPILPLFIFGFLLKIARDENAIQIFTENLGAFGVIVTTLWGYLLLLLIVAGRGNFARIKEIFMNILPAVITAFSAMSSAAALPLSLNAAGKNTKDQQLANLVMPTTVNIHLIGDGICLPMTAIVLMNVYGLGSPDIFSYLVFAMYFLVTKFAVAAIPGGGVIVMVPVLQKYLGFNQEMSVLITTIYLLMDPIITSANVMGNNLLCIFFKKLAGPFAAKPRQVKKAKI
jgi:Na+/H+-dicarboxylate symporter